MRCTQNADPSLAEWKGVCNSTIGTFPKDYVLDSTKTSAEDIAAATSANAGTPEVRALRLACSCPQLLP